MAKGDFRRSLRTFVRRESFELTDNLCDIFNIPKHSRMLKIKKVKICH